MNAGGSHIAHPKLNARIGGIGESKMPAVRRPIRSAQVGILRKLDVLFLSILNVNQVQPGQPWRMVPAVRDRINAYSGQAQHGLGKVRDGRIAQPVSHQKVI